MKEYNPKKIEEKWQKKWEKENTFKAVDPPASGSKKPKYYILVEFPYPSGDGLHVGHPRSYVGLDILARKKRKEGFNVLFPMGWDSFGLPTENYAIKTGIHPVVATKENIEVFKDQEKKLGLSFDWDREINTTDPSYYKWTQWIFIQLFKKGLAYKAKMPINWCTSCKIGLANEEVVNDVCERCGSKVVEKEKEQWMLKITEYADRLLKDLDKVDYPERVKAGQKEWIGRSEGAEIEFKIQDSDNSVLVFTTRSETIFGCTYLVLSPGHPLAKDVNPKTRAINPVNNKKIPVFVADYVLTEYGTGAIMAVPGHDQRDLDFAKEHSLPVIEVVKKDVLVDSGNFTGMKSEKAREEIIEWLSKKGRAKKTINYKLRDWIFSRQRYWGEPIPMVNCKKCGWLPVPEKDLPVELPKIKDYKPGKEGESALAKAKSWIGVDCPKCGFRAKRETDVMPNWAGSNWYFLRYCDPNNKKKLADPKKLEYWMPVDWYNGGMEHTTLHLLYSRFIFKFLWDIGVIPKPIGSEPYKKRTSHGMILGEGGIKMSKSKGNVINPNKIVEEYGADVLRVYEMFMGPFEQTIPWDVKGLKGAQRFLKKVWRLKDRVGNEIGDGRDLEKTVHQTIKKVTEDIESLKFNTAISSLMVLVNEMEKQKEISMNYYSVLLILLNPFAPHTTEELWEELCDDGLCWNSEWPKYNPKLVKEEKVSLIIQVNGKVRDKIETDIGLSEVKTKKIALSSDKMIKYIKGNKIKNIIFVKDRLINFVI
ncbi:leucine--tRNA ligase [Patescibacteria group bacterium]|nr:leucine--tRNA ligase [Patescibacteria group bacterium]